jgi:hypothetical protein
LSSSPSIQAVFVVFVYAGTQLARIQRLSDVASPRLLLAFTLLGIFPLIARGIVRTLRKRRVYARWRRPSSFDRNLVVIGAGAAGLFSAYIAATVRAQVTLIEAHRMGGDCLNYVADHQAWYASVNALFGSVRKFKADYSTIPWSIFTGDLLAEFVLAMKHGLGLAKVLGTIHIYPTLAEANKSAAGEWRRAHAPHRLLPWVARYHAWLRT